jgi:hypothetical protein
MSLQGGGDSLLRLSFAIEFIASFYIPSRPRFSGSFTLGASYKVSWNLKGI